MIRRIILTMLILSILLLGCQKEEEVITQTEEVSVETEINIDAEIAEIDSLDADLNLDELDNLEAELDEINW